MRSALSWLLTAGLLFVGWETIWDRYTAGTRAPTIQQVAAPRALEGTQGSPPPP